MSLEIERKFLVINDEWVPRVRSSWRYTQGYLALADNEVRVRVIEPLDGMPGFSEACFTVKGQGDLVREEVEVGIDISKAKDLLKMCGGRVLEKVRHKVADSCGNTFEIDVYEGALKGLVVAEVELPSVDSPFETMSFIGEEITFNKGYKNAALACSIAPSPSRPSMR